MGQGPELVEGQAIHDEIASTCPPKLPAKAKARLLQLA
jgi:hypothetical protein